MTTPSLAGFPARHFADGSGIYSVCSAHGPSLEAALDQAVADGGCALVEATSNQVDQYGGYTGMTPPAFRDWVAGLARERGLPPERLILGGDHLGPNPWRDRPADAALAEAGELVRQYVAAGFGKIHLDCSMALGGDAGPAPDPEVVAARAAGLCRTAENAAREAGLPPPVYVVGTEVPVPGGATHDLDDGVPPTAVADARGTLEVHRAAFAKEGLQAAWERVIGLVVQPGVEFGNYTVADYDRDRARELSEFIAGAGGGMVFEAHSSDYQTPGNLARLVEDHYAILKVGPWLTYAYRQALFGLECIARELGSAVRFRAELERVMVEKPGYWKSHYHGAPAEQALARAFSFSDRVRYYWPEAELARAEAALFAAPELERIPLPLLEQYMPVQYAAVREGGLEARPRALARHAVTEVLGIYSRATGQSQAF